MEKFLIWANDIKLDVIWYEDVGELRREPLAWFNPSNDETPLELLNRVVKWVNQMEYVDSDGRNEDEIFCIKRGCALNPNEVLNYFSRKF